MKGITMDNIRALCVLETIGSGLTLANENEREIACRVGIQAIDTIEQIKKIITEEEHYEVSNSLDNPRPNQADYDSVSADKFKRIWKVVSEAESKIQGF